MCGRDWSSGVCSSDLHLLHPRGVGLLRVRLVVVLLLRRVVSSRGGRRVDVGALGRSEERRVGKECRPGWVACDEKETLVNKRVAVQVLNDEYRAEGEV